MIAWSVCAVRDITLVRQLQVVSIYLNLCHAKYDYYYGVIITISVIKSTIITNNKRSAEEVCTFHVKRGQSLDYSHMICNESETGEDSGFDNASCSESGQSCVEDYECKCTELQNPSIMQYYPTAWTSIQDPGSVVNRRTHCQCDVKDRTRERTKDNNKKTEASAAADGTETDGETDSVLTDTEGRHGKLGSLHVLGLPKNFSSVQLSVILIGDSNTGKTSLIARFADDKLIENYDTTIGKLESLYIVIGIESPKGNPYGTYIAHFIILNRLV